MLIVSPAEKFWDVAVAILIIVAGFQQRDLKRLTVDLQNISRNYYYLHKKADPIPEANGKTVLIHGKYNHSNIRIPDMNIDFDGMAAKISARQCQWVVESKAEDKSWTTMWSAVPRIGDLQHYNPWDHSLSSYSTWSEFTIGKYTVDMSLVKLATTNRDYPKVEFQPEYSLNFSSSKLFESGLRYIGDGIFFRGYRVIKPWELHQTLCNVGESYLEVTVFDPDRVTVVGRLDGNRIVPTVLENGEAFALLSDGKMSMPDIVNKHFQSSQTYLIIVLVIIAVCMVLHVITCLNDLEVALWTTGAQILALAATRCAFFGPLLGRNICASLAVICISIGYSKACM